MYDDVLNAGRKWGVRTLEEVRNSASKLKRYHKFARIIIKLTYLVAKETGNWKNVRIFFGFIIYYYIIFLYFVYF